MHSAFSAAAVTSSADEPVREAVTGVIGALVLGPTVCGATGMPGDAANATEIKVVITHRFYGGVGVAVGAGAVTSVEIVAAYSVSGHAGNIISCKAARTEPVSR